MAKQTKVYDSLNDWNARKMREEHVAAARAARTRVVNVETVTELGKVRVEFADGKYAYLTLEEVGAALRLFAEGQAAPAHAEADRLEVYADSLATALEGVLALEPKDSDPNTTHNRAAAVARRYRERGGK